MIKPQIRKKFQPPSVYYTHVLLYIFGIGLSLGLCIYLFSPEGEILALTIKNEEISGHARQIRDSAILKVIVYYFGVSGLITISAIALLGFSIALYYKVYELIRYYRKNRLYVNGLVNNLDDDNPSPNFFKHIYLLFTRKRKDKASKVLLDKKEIEKLKQNKLYKKLYGD